MSALNAALNGTMAVIDVAAGGDDSAKNTFTATQIVVLLSNQPAPPGLPTH
jgi:hypothetical protein